MTDLDKLSEKEAEVVLSVVRWMRNGPTFSSVHLHKGSKSDLIKARLEVTGGLDVLCLTNKTD